MEIKIRSLQRGDEAEVIEMFKLGMYGLGRPLFIEFISAPPSLAFFFIEFMFLGFSLSISILNCYY